MDHRTGTALKLVASAQALLLALPAAAFAATKDPSTGLVIDKVAVEAGRLKITGTARLANQAVRLDAPNVTVRSNAQKKFAIDRPAILGDCSVFLFVGNRRSQPLAVSGCGPIGPVGPGVSAQGGWNSLKPYKVNDLVVFDGATYRAKAVSIGKAPNVNTTEWELFAARGAAGPAGAQGVAGPMGPTGSTGPAGPVGAQWKGLWGNEASYAPNDLVTYDGSTWRATAATVGGQTPGADSVWAMVAKQGERGPSGFGDLRYRGVWSPAPEGGPYDAKDVVTDNGSAWYAKVDNPTGQPSQVASDQGDWGIFVSRGALGPTGAQGPIGPQGPAGAGNVIIRGDWQSLTSYAVNDVVSYDGSLWLKLTNASTGAPASGPDWTLLVAKGTDGTAGATGAAGPTGAQGPAGLVSTAAINDILSNARTLQPSPAATPTFAFIGPTKQVSVSAGERISASVSLSIDDSATATPGPIGTVIRIAACRQAFGSQLVTPLVDTGVNNGQNYAIPASWDVVTVFGSTSNVVPGQYNVGLCAAYPTADPNAPAITFSTDASSGLVTVSGN